MTPGSAMRVAPTAETALPSKDTILGLVSQELEQVVCLFAKELGSEIPVIRQMGDHLLRGGGKRIRPALHLLACQAIGCDDPKRITLASVFELIHTATLVHDDVIDEADRRRGLRSLNSIKGNTMTVLLGDFLYLKSVILTLRNEDLDILRRISSVTAEMIEGELLQEIKLGDLSVSIEDYEAIVRRKTAALFSVCCESAAMLAGASETTRAALADYGLSLGLAFQIVDDMLDFTSDEVTLGKPVLSDLREGKVTLPIIHLLAGLKDGKQKDVKEEIAEVIATGCLSAARKELIMTLVDETGGVEKSLALAGEYADKARQAILALPAGEARSALEVLPDYVLHRDR